MQWLTKDTGYAFVGVEKLLQETFLTCLFFGKLKSLPPIVGTLSTIPVKKFGLSLQDPVTPANQKYLRMLRGSSNMIGSITEEREFSNIDHLLALREEMNDAQKIRDDAQTIRDDAKEAKI